MKKLCKLIPVSIVLGVCIGMFLVPDIVTPVEKPVAGRDVLPAQPQTEIGDQPSTLGELPCRGTRHDLVTPIYYGYLAGPGTGRAIGFSVDSYVTISSVGILGDLVAQSFDVVIYDSPDGHSAGSELYSTTYYTGGTGYGWNDMPVSFTFAAGDFYVVNWRPNDGNSSWAYGLEYYDDAGLPWTVGPVTILEGIEGYDADNPDNFLHINFRFCEVGSYDFCFQIYPFCDQVYLSLSGGLIEGYDDECGYGCPFLVGGVFYGINQWNLFFDMEDDACDHDYEYGVITGSVLSGSLQRYYPDGTPFDSDPTAITLVPCDMARPATKGPLSRVEE